MRFWNIKNVGSPAITSIVQQINILAQIRRHFILLLIMSGITGYPCEAGMAQQVQISVGENIQISKVHGNGSVGEAMIAAHPRDENILVACGIVWGIKTSDMRET